MSGRIPRNPDKGKKMAVSKTSCGTWKCDVVLEDGTRKRKSGFRTRADAQEWEQFTRTSSRDTIAQFALDYLDEMRMKNKMHSVRAKATVLNGYLVPFLGAKRLDSLNDADLIEFKHHISISGKQRSTQNLIIQVTNHVLGQAYKKGKTVKRLKLDYFPKEEKAIRVIGLDQERAMMHVLSPEMQALAVFILNTGLRTGEAFALRDSDCYGDHIIVRHTLQRDGTLTSPKSGKTRKIPLNAKAKAILEQRKHLERKFDFTYVTIRYWARVIEAAIGIDFTWHVLRHTFATRVANSGTPLHVLQKLLGHSTIAYTMRYAQVYDDNLVQAVNSLE